MTEDGYEGFVNLSERLAALEFALEDARYYRLTMGTEEEFSREGLRRISELVNVMYLKNPLILRGVNVQRDYVFGQGIGVHAEPEWAEAAVRAFWDDPKNQVELTSLQSLGEKEVDLQLDGNLFFVFFRSTDGRSGNAVWVRSIPFGEVAEILTDPEDRKSAWFYKRVWNEERLDYGSGTPTIQSRTAYYPDWQYDGPERPGSIGGFEVRWESPVYHVRVGGRGNMRFGMSEVYAGIDWALAYKTFLENWATIVRAYSVFAWQLTTQGGKAGIAAAKARLGTTVTTDSSETNPPPVTGSVFIAGEGRKLEPIRTAGATTDAEDGRRLLLMVAATMGLPETFFGDVSVGTLATGKSLDRPTELKMRMRQSLWKDVLTKVLRWVIEDGRPTTEVKVMVTFPPILEHDVSASVSAVVQAATLGNYQMAGLIDEETITKMLLTALGETDVEGVIEKLRDRMEEEPSTNTRMAGENDTNDSGEEAPAEEEGMVEEGMIQAARELREVVTALMEGLRASTLPLERGEE